MASTLSVPNLARKYKILRQLNWHLFWHKMSNYDVAFFMSFMSNFLYFWIFPFFIYHFQENYPREYKSWNCFFNISNISWDITFSNLKNGVLPCKIILNLRVTNLHWRKLKEKEKFEKGNSWPRKNRKKTVLWRHKMSGDHSLVCLSKRL